MLRKIGLSLLAIFMVLGVLMSSVMHNNTKAADTHKTKVNIHKILLNKDEFNSFNVGHTGVDNKTKYNGTQIADIQGYFGSSAKEIEGVAFRIFKVVDENTANAKQGSDASMPADLKKGDYANKYYIEVTADNGDTAQNSPFITKGNGIADVVLENGKYVVIEDKTKSPYYSTDGKELTDSKAIPFELDLPVTKPDGTGLFDTTTPLHVYPKNTEDKPEVTKKFEDIEAMQRDVMIGKEIPYKVTTVIPQNAKYKTIKWTDTMVKGLDFVQDTLTVEDNKNLSLVKDTDYTVTQNIRGFILKLTDTGLAKVEQKATEGSIEFTLKYKGILNDSAAIETYIPNEVQFDYGNRPGFDSKPKSGKPSNKEIVVNKTWEGTQPTGTTIKFKVYEKVTGALAGEIVLGQNSNKLTNLDNEKEYVIIEDSVSGYAPEYKTFENGMVTIHNKKNPNPTPIKPEPPKVKTYGKKFVKTNNEEKDNAELKKLADAQFVIKNSENKFLKLKDTNTQSTEITAYKNAEKEYQDAVKENSGDIDTKKAARDAAYEALNMQWDWVDSQSDAFTFVSSKDGKFEVKGLAPGTYNLVETKAPEGFALLQTPIEFMVADGSWNDMAGIEGYTQVKNKEITIPQTGGMGTLIFTVVGVSLMGLALVAMRRRNKEQ